MSVLVRKEIRLVSPIWLLVLALEMVFPWLQQDLEAAVYMAPIGFFFGMILLAVDPLGREFYLGTFTNLLSQPLERQRIWRAKISVLFIGAAMIFIAYLASCSLRLHLALSSPATIWHANPKLIWDELWMTMLSSVALFFVALSGGLWTALLFRQIAAAFWISFLVPISLFMAMEYFLPSSWEQNKWVTLAIRAGAAAIYSAWGFWLAHRLFHRAQDAGWTGGVISFSRWRYFESTSESSVSLRKKRPILALFKKELQLQSISWFCAAALVVLHGTVIVMRMLHGPYAADTQDSLSRLLSEFFWAVWLIMPLIIGCTAVAEERRLTVTESQFCQPVSRRIQFAVKFVPTIVAGILLGGVMPILLEGIAAFLGAPNQDFNFYNQPHDGFVSLAAISALAVTLSFTAAYASTLVTTFLQAMGLSVVLIICAAGFEGVVVQARSFLGLSLNPPVTAVVATLTALIVVPWLTFGNYKQLEERVRIWKRNAVTLAIGACFIGLGSSALYNRAWEVFEPVEPAHGAARLSLANPPVLQNSAWDMLSVRTPGGQFWADRLGYPDSVHGLHRAWLALWDPLPRSIGPQQFVSGSNWVSAAVRYVDAGVNDNFAKRIHVQMTTNRIIGYLDTIGIRNDGTLWISQPNQGRWNGNKLTRFGNGTDWKQVVYVHTKVPFTYSTILLLKRDGTLWRWNLHSPDWSQWPPHWPTLQTSGLDQIGTNSDWTELSGDLRAFARKADGSVWNVIVDEDGIHFSHDRRMDSISLKNFSSVGVGDNMAYVHPDGTLWASVSQGDRKELPDFKQVGTQTNWMAASISFNRLVALKSDGTLWIWHGYRGLWAELDEPPTQMGIHHDWVAVTGDWSSVITLAADGSLWLWPDREPYYYSTPLKLPKQPKLLGNIFAKAN